MHRLPASTRPPEEGRVSSSPAARPWEAPPPDPIRLRSGPGCGRPCSNRRQQPRLAVAWRLAPARCRRQVRPDRSRPRRRGRPVAPKRTRCSRQRARLRSARTWVGQPDRRRQLAAGELGQHPGVDPVGLAGKRRQPFHLLRVRDHHLPARELEPLVRFSRRPHLRLGCQRLRPLGSINAPYLGGSGRLKPQRLTS
jgi:hypothetical protein